MPVTKHPTVVWLVLLGLLIIWAATYYVAWRLGAPRWGLTAISCIGGAAIGILVGRLRLARRNKSAGVEVR